MKAVTVRVNDVEGVAGFVLPGDRVDVMLTRQSDKTTPPPTWCCRTCACWRSIRSPTNAPTSLGGQGGHARGRQSARAEDLARGVGRHPVADAAQGRRGDRSIRGASRSTICRSRPLRGRYSAISALGADRTNTVPVEGNDRHAVRRPERNQPSLSGEETTACLGKTRASDGEGRAV